MKNDRQAIKWPKFLYLYSRSLLLGLMTLVIILGLHLLWGIPGLTQETTTLKVLVNALEAKEWSSLVEEFEEKNPQIEIEVVEGPTDSNLVENLYSTAFLLGKSPYDLVYMDIIWVPKFAAAGWLQDLSGKIGPSELQDFLEKDIEAGRYKGGLYRIPFRSDVGVLYYRSDLLKQGGYEPPENFDRLQTIAQELQQSTESNWGYLWQGKQYEGLSAMFVEVLEGYGGVWIDPETKAVGLDKPEAIAAVEFLRHAIESGITPSGVTTYTESESLRFFLNGESVFLRNWPYVWAEANKPSSPIQGKVGLKAMVHAPGESSGAAQGGWGLGIAKTSKHSEEAWKFIDFFTSRDSQKQYILDYSYIPSRRSLFRDPEVVDKYSYYPKLLQAIDNAVLRPPIPQYAQVSDILQRYLTAALTGSKTPEAAMKKAAAETRRVLGTS